MGGSGELPDRESECDEVLYRMPNGKWTEIVSKWWRSFVQTPQARVATVASEDTNRNSGRLSHPVAVPSTSIPGLEAVARDLSESGVCLVSTQEVPLGNRLELSLRFRESDFPVRFVGECRWSRKPEDGPYEIGLDLSSSNPRSLAVLKRFLAETK